MKVAIRADSSISIGSGHIMRCLTLADQLVARGAEVQFVCKKMPGAMIDFIAQRGFFCSTLDAPVNCQDEDVLATSTAIKAYFPAGVDWLIIDHYDLDAKWEQEMRQIARNIMVIDDLANRPHNCDLLLDQNYYRNSANRYDGLVSTATIRLLGPQFALLRPEFFEVKRTVRKRDGTVRRILVFFGGSDPENQTNCALQAIKDINRPDIHVDVVVGSSNQYQEKIQSFCDARSWAHYHCQIAHMARLMVHADLAVGAGGATTWERCFLGLPCITVVFAENQLALSQDVAKAGAAMYLGQAIDCTVACYTKALNSLIHDSNKLTHISETALSLFSTKEGVVADVMTSIHAAC